jgi:3D-(3,5/4)-trihydroxycyclohexane-1,2-dione acylhydrolase (decyclizing)
MGFAAAAYAKQWLRQRFMFCTASAGPGTANLLTAAALAHANRLPMLMLCGDTFLTRLPDPVLQQLEHFGNPALGRERRVQGRDPLLGPDHASGAGHPVAAAPSPPCSIRPIAARHSSACRRMCRAGPMTTRKLFSSAASIASAARHPMTREIADAAAALKTAERPLIIAGGGVQYSRRGRRAHRLRRKATSDPGGRNHRRSGQPVGDHPLNIGPSASPARTAPTPLPNRPMSSLRSAPACRISPPDRGQPSQGCPLHRAQCRAA